jgi:hypothetical protein
MAVRELLEEVDEAMFAEGGLHTSSQEHTPSSSSLLHFILTIIYADKLHA